LWGLGERKRGREVARIAIVDDHDFMRETMTDMLSDEPDLTVVGVAADGREAIELCRSARPDLVLMDVRMPHMDGLTATREIKRQLPTTSVLMVTMHENTDYLLEALRAGAAGYVLKDATRNELTSAVRGVLSGESPVDSELATRLLRRLAAEDPGGAAGARNGGGNHSLTPREVEVLGLMAEGQTNRQIAQSFVISVGTVKNHVEHIIAKLGVSDRTQAVVRALETGIIGFPDR
jgi:DNA-binding NarL/FixJ family response regulator